MNKTNVLQRCLTDRASGHRHDGEVIAPESNLRWISDGFELRCTNGESICVTFAIDADDREIIGWTACSYSGYLLGVRCRDLMLMCVKRRFGHHRALHAVEWLSDNGHANTSHETVDFAISLGLVLSLPSPRQKYLAESFANRFLRNYVNAHARPDAATVLGQLDNWFENYTQARTLPHR
ncbi:DDE-type integrase/transposase/recombinase [Paraburkholderia sp. BCC1885]|uniref:DDE-type integrase/transposase/recombinase n=1 Tax=Paraburkholderia sp. BCC1885 TaxID=2562669 RepID=UPI001184093E|nr:DDE-type integrase/transposase/recombinase [Paraburkholderia sp. BCC1885]